MAQLPLAWWEIEATAEEEDASFEGFEGMKAASSCHQGLLTTKRTIIGLRARRTITFRPC
jgi:hypothetical protein